MPSPLRFPTADAPLTEIRAAQDAELTLWAGTGAEQTVSSATNTFTSLLPGVDVTVSKTSTEPVTVSVARDTEATSKAASDLVDSLNDLFKFIATNSAVTSGAGGATSGMIFTGDSTARDVKKLVMDAVVMPIDGKSPSEIGISITKDGKLEFNAEKFAKVLAEDPARIESVVQTIASRVSTVTANLSDKYDGAITSRIKGQESMVSRLGTQVLDWDRRLATREATLKRTYSALEVQLSKLNSQQSYMASQLNSLNDGCAGQMMMNPAQKRAQLNREAILSASPARLLTMLYDRLLLDLNRAEAAQLAQDWIAASDNLVHAQDIIAELVSSLNTDSWDGAQGLQSLYAFATQTLVNANIRRDPALTRQAISLLEPLRQAWHEAAAVPVAAPALDGGTFLG